MKRTWTCPKCGGQKVGYLESVPDGGDHGSGATERVIGDGHSGSLLGMKTYRRTGEIEAFVCTICGYFEEYVRSPEAIDWEGLRGFRWCRPPAG